MKYEVNRKLLIKFINSDRQMFFPAFVFSRRLIPIILEQEIKEGTLMMKGGLYDQN